MLYDGGLLGRPGGFFPWELSGLASFGTDSEWAVCSAFAGWGL